MMNEQIENKFREIVKKCEYEKENDRLGYIDVFEKDVYKISLALQKMKTNDLEDYEIPKGEMLNLVLNFYETLSSEFYDQAKAIIKNKNGNIFRMKKLENNEKGYINHNYIKGTDTITIPNRYTLENALVLVHELGHSMDTMKKNANRYNFEMKKLFSETTALAFEKIFIEYLWNNTNYPKENILNIMLKRHNYFYDVLSDFILTQLLIRTNDKIDNFYEILYYFIVKERKIDFKNFSNRIEEYVNKFETYTDMLNYGISSKLSEILLLDYKKRGIKSLEQYIKAIQDLNKESYIYNFLTFPTDEIMNLEQYRISQKKKELKNNTVSQEKNEFDINFVLEKMERFQNEFENAMSAEDFSDFNKAK